MLVDLRWVSAFLVSAVCHEMCHLLALWLQGCPVNRIAVGIFGAQIQTDLLTSRQEFIASLAGPVGGLLLMQTAQWFPRLAVCGFFHSAVNLIPLYPLDGGRALRCVLPLKIYGAAQWGVTLVIALLAGRAFGVMGWLIVFSAVIKPVLEKLLAKKGRSGYNIHTPEI
jgi:membrane-associated protease RseP (regulator of RpoE activity)